MKVSYTTLKWLGGIFFIVFAIAMFASSFKFWAALDIKNGITSVLISFLFLWAGIHLLSLKKMVCHSNKIYIGKEQLAIIDQGGLPTLMLTPVVLNQGESNHYYADAELVVTKERVLGSAGNSTGGSYRLFRGFTARTSSYSSQRIYGDVRRAFQGRLVITNQRIVFLHTQMGCEIKMKDIVAILPYKNGIGVQTGNKTYMFLLGKSQYPLTVIRRIMA